MQPIRIARKDITWLQLLAFLEFFLALLAVVIVPKATVVAIALLAAVALAVLWPIRTTAFSHIRPDHSVLWLTALAFWAGLSAAWSPVPFETLAAAAFLPLLASATAVIILSSQYAPLTLASQCRFGFSMGLVVAVALFSLDLLSAQGLTRWVFTNYPSLSETPGKHVFFEGGEAIHVSEASANRRATIIVLLMLPLVHHLARIEHSWRHWFVIGVTALGYMVTFLLTESLSSQVAFLVGGLTFLAGTLCPRFVRVFVATVWISAFILFIPAALALKAAGLQESKYLSLSARERVVIWSVTAHHILQNPLAGIGANASRGFAKLQGPRLAVERTPLGQPTFVHPHSAYLQIWYELGAPGAALLMGLGLAIINRIANLRPEFQPYAFGQFSSVSALIASSFGLWQYWLLSAIAMGVMTLMLVEIVAKREVTERKAPAGPRPVQAHGL